jgi:hypothetical protein
MELSMETGKTDLVAYCGLYCGQCGAFTKGRCPGCHEKTNANWCRVRSCCIKNGHASCADCTTFDDPNKCRGFNNLIARAFGFIFRSDRRACIQQIRQKGIQFHADEMTRLGRQSIRR